MKILPYIIFAVSFLFGTRFAFSQHDTLIVEDSLLTEEHLETLGEQTVEDSPLLDFLSSDVMGSKIHYRSRISKQLQSSRGFRESIYKGSPLKLYERIKFKYSEHLEGGILTEKDAGERKFADFLAGQLVISNFSFLNKLILGDYYVEVGQGVVLWRNYDISKGADVILPIYKKGNGIRPYLSSWEEGFFRGVAAKFLIKNIATSLFYSHRFKSATVDSFGNIRAFYELGYFRTNSEESKRNNVSENLFGILTNVEVSKHYRIGISWYKSNLSNPLYVNENAKSTSRVFKYLSVDYEFSVFNLSLFGEWSKFNSLIGGTSGLLINPIKNLRIISSFRYYPSECINLHGLPFGENSKNEQGFYMGIQVQPYKFLSINSYFDLFSFPERTSTLFPSNGNDIFTESNLKLNDKTNFILRFHRKITTQQFIITDEQGFNKKVDGFQSKQILRLQIDHRMSKKVSIRGRYEMTFLNREYGIYENGICSYYDFNYFPIEIFWFNLRVVFFKTDSYETRIYEYERDLPGVLSQPVLYGKGVRWYLIMKFSLSSGIDISAKYSDQIRDDVKYIGTGYDQLPTNHDDRINFQFDFKF